MDTKGSFRKLLCPEAAFIYLAPAVDHASGQGNLQNDPFVSTLLNALLKALLKALLNALLNAQN